MQVKYSVVIPAYNEEIFLDNLLQNLSKINNCEIIVVDGGSTDRTIEIAEENNAQVVTSQFGRGLQLNAGASAAKGEIICFLHADTIPPQNMFELLNVFFENRNSKICRFKLNFDIDHWLLDTYKYFSKYDTIFTRFGDTTINVRKDFFESLGGFPNWKSFEDVEFLRKASKYSKITILNAEAVSSARAFTKFGIIKQQLISGLLISKYLFGLRNFIRKNDYYRKDQKKIAVSIIVFLKYPSKGKVKTRLAKTIGNEKAVLLYKKMAEKVLSTISKVKNSYKYIFYSDKNDKIFVRKWIKKKYFYSAQVGSDLGTKMQNAFRVVFSHGAAKAIVVGTDIPDLSNSILINAINKLDESDVVIGPSRDGGFYLLGMKRYLPFLFEGISYSTNSVFEETLYKFKENNLTYHILETLVDIDTDADLKEWLSVGEKSQLKEEINLIYNNKSGKNNLE